MCVRCRNLHWETLDRISSRMGAMLDGHVAPPAAGLTSDDMS